VVDVVGQAADVVDVVGRAADVVGQVAHVVGRAADVVGQVVAHAVGRAVSVVDRAARARQRLLLLQQEARQMPAAKKAVRLVTEDVVETPAVAETAAPEAPEAAPTGPRLRITLLKSSTGYKYDQKRTLVALGLRRLHATVERPDNASVRGMVTKVEHLVRVEEIGQS
jgi:large subunit ribosomal protein L30